MNIENILTKLEKVESRGAERWIARCPAHPDRSPSLAIKISGEQVLLHCFAGCSVEQILDSINAEWADIMPQSKPTGYKHKKSFFPASDVLACLEHELLVCVLVAQQMVDGESIDSEDKERLALAVQRIDEARSLSSANH